jgi:hypothetical protein
LEIDIFPEPVLDMVLLIVQDNVVLAELWMLDSKSNAFAPQMSNVSWDTTVPELFKIESD